MDHRYEQLGYWWADDVRTSTSRKALIDKWYIRLVDAPKPNKKAFCEQLEKWSGDLGRTAWVGRSEKYGADAAFFARLSSAEKDQPEVWHAVSLLYKDYGAPLAHFTAGFYLETVKERPSGLPVKLGNQVYTRCRSACVAVHDTMISDEFSFGLVLDSQDRADTFLVEKEKYHDELLVVAMRSMTLWLKTMLERVDVGSDPHTVKVLREKISGLTERFGDPGEPTPRHDPEEYIRARGELDPVFKSMKYLQDKDNIFRNEVQNRAIKYLIDLRNKGNDMPLNLVLWRTSRRTEIDKHRADGREARRKEKEAAIARGEHLIDTRTRRGLVKKWIDNLVDYPAPAPDGMGDCWEKTALDGLLRRAVTDDSVLLDIRAAIGDAVHAVWSSGAPESASSSTARVAEQYMWGIFAVITGQGVGDE